MRLIHLHPLGGAAGDMFVAFLLDAFPEHRAAVAEAAEGLAHVGCRLVLHGDGMLTGSRFVVDNVPHDHGIRANFGDHAFIAIWDW